MLRIKLGALLAALGLAMSLVTCAGVPLTAPGGTTLKLIANPTFVAANGGRSVVAAILTEPAGTFVPNGTEVFFFTDLGTIEASAKTRDGVARVNFVSDSRSGRASITALSGGAAAPAPQPSASASTTPPPSSGGGTNSDSITIDIGSALPQSIVLGANPQRITEPRYSEITANVFDGSGNPVRNVPVIFTLKATPLQERLDSGSQPVYTDSNGQARDVLRTSQNRADPQKIVTVTATLPTGDANDITVAVN
jgi:hypothetical protein